MRLIELAEYTTISPSTVEIGPKFEWVCGEDDVLMVLRGKIEVHIFIPSVPSTDEAPKMKRRKSIVQQKTTENTWLKFQTITPGNFLFIS